MANFFGFPFVTLVFPSPHNVNTTNVLLGSGPSIYNSFNVFKFHGILNICVTSSNSFSVTFPDTACDADEH